MILKEKDLKVFQGQEIGIDQENTELSSNEYTTKNPSGKKIKKRLNPERWMPIMILKNKQSELFLRALK